MASREIARRLAQLEAHRGPHSLHYSVSDRPLTDEEWEASKDGADLRLDEPDRLTPILTEAEWAAMHCKPDPSEAR